MNIKEEMENLVESIDSRMNVNRVYGAPIAAEGKTIIPVARIGYGFGAGFGQKNPEPASEKEGEGGGGGGGGTAVPLGVIEVTSEATRFIPVNNMKRNLILLGAGIVLGSLVLGRK